MSTETTNPGKEDNTLNISTSMEDPKDRITADDFDRLFEAEEKALSGDKKDLRDVTKEIEGKFTNPVAQEAPAAVVETPKEPEAPVAGGEAETNTEATNTWLESLDPAIRANVEKLMQEKAAAEQAKEQYIKSNDGRIAAEQRKARQLEAELQKARAAQAAVAAPKTPAIEAEDDDDKELFEALKESDPALYKILKRDRDAREAAVAKLHALESTFEVQQKTLEERQINTEMDRLGSIVSNYQEIWDSDAYQWYMDNEAPRSVQRAAATPTAEGAAQAIFAYGQWMQARQEAAQPSQPTTTTPPTNVPNPAAVEQAQRVQQERERKISAQPVASTTTARPSASPTDSFADIASDPKKLQEFHNQVFEQELKRLGVAP